MTDQPAVTTPTEPTVTRDNASTFGEYGEFQKRGSTRISLFTMPPGTTYQTPEGLRAEDEETRIAFDVQGGVYPIRESVFQQSYRVAEARATAPSLDVEVLRMVRESIRRATEKEYDGEPVSRDLHDAAATIDLILRRLTENADGD